MPFARMAFFLTYSNLDKPACVLYIKIITIFKIAYYEG